MGGPRLPSILALAIVCAAAAAALLAAADPAQARASRASRQNSRLFRELIVSGERPEIVACMVAAVEHSHSDRVFSGLRWGADVSDTAYMRETDGGIHMTRTIRFKGESQRRSRSLFAVWEPVEVVCEQRDEEPLEVKIKSPAP